MARTAREAKSSRTKRTPVAEAVAEAFNPYGNVTEVLDKIEKELDISDGGLAPNEARMSTGLLCLDLVLGGGITAGWYTNFGQEQSCKTTLAVNILFAALAGKIPFLGYWDFEGSASPDYYETIMSRVTKRSYNSISEVFGEKDNKGAWIHPPIIRYRSEAVAEKFFDFLASVERRLPDKKLLGDQWYYVYEDNKVNRALVKDKFDKNYLSKTGKLRVPAPDGSLQALILVDSYPAMLPEKQDVDDPNNAIATQARMFSDQLKRVKGRMRGKRIAVFGINQLRMKPMVMFGCLHADTKIPFTDGSCYRIQDVVDNKIQGNVWSYDETEAKFVEKPITAWHYNGEVADVADWITIQSVCPEGNNGVAAVTVTPDHRVFTTNGWTAAKNLVVNDLVLSKYESQVSGSLLDFLSGCVSSDATIVADSKVGAVLRFQDNENPAYLNWKLSKLGCAFSFKRTTCGKGKTAYTSNRTYELNLLKEKIGNRCPWEVSHSKLSLALMYMDDGTYRGNHGCVISYKRFKNSTNDLSKIVGIYESFGVYPKIGSKGALRFTKGEAEKLYELIARYVPEPMHYKLPPEYHNRYREFHLTFDVSVKPVFEQLVSIETGSYRKFRQRGKYDISVKDCKNYLAGSPVSGLLVHNSPEYEPGGEALKLYSDVRLKCTSRAISAVSDARGKGQIELEPSITGDGDDEYRYIHIRAHKNKLSVPYLECFQRLWIKDVDGVAQGFDLVYDTYEYLKSTGQAWGNRKAVNIHLHGQDKPFKKPLPWNIFKTLILGDKASIRSIFTKLGLKPMMLRAFCEKQMKSGKGLDLYFTHQKQAKKDAIARKKANPDADDDSSEE